MNRSLGQDISALHNFSPASGITYTNSDGAYPVAGLALSGNTLYGTTAGGGIYGRGTVFRVAIDGNGFTNLHSFSMTFGALSTNPDGATPSGRLLLVNNTLYGTTRAGGAFGSGVIFRLNPDGTGFTNMHSFAATPDTLPWVNSDGANPNGGLVMSGQTLFGTTQYGGTAGNGTVFSIDSSGSGFNSFYSFTSGTGTWPYVTNNDGAFPKGTMVLSGNTLYGTAGSGGEAANGVVFSVNTNGMNMLALHIFTSQPGRRSTNSDGAGPAGMILSASVLYGTANLGGSSGYGTVFALNRDGSGFTNLHNFPSAFLSTNAEGAYPNPGLLLLGSTLYGTSSGGGRFINLPGSGGNGTIFSISTAGTGFTNLHDFSAAPDETNSEGFYPNGEMVRLGNDLYGTANDGGAYANGTVFKFSLTSQPLLKILRLGTNMIISWPTNATGFSLQSAINTGPTFIWSNISASSGVVGSDRVVTDAVAGPRRFYRLIR